MPGSPPPRVATSPVQAVSRDYSQYVSAAQSDYNCTTLAVDAPSVHAYCPYSGLRILTADHSDHSVATPADAVQSVFVDTQAFFASHAAALSDPHFDLCLAMPHSPAMTLITMRSPAMTLIVAVDVTVIVVGAEAGGVTVRRQLTPLVMLS